MKSVTVTGNVESRCAKFSLALFAAASIGVAGCSTNSSPASSSQAGTSTAAPPAAKQAAQLPDATPAEWRSYGNLWRRGSVTKVRIIGRSIQELDLSTDATLDFAQKLGEIEGKLLSLLSDARKDRTAAESAVAQEESLSQQVNQICRTLTEKQKGRSQKAQAAMGAQVMLLMAKPGDFQKAVEACHLSGSQQDTVAIAIARYQHTQNSLTAKLAERASSPNGFPECFTLSDQREALATETLFAVRDALNSLQRGNLDRGF